MRKGYKYLRGKTDWKQLPLILLLAHPPSQKTVLNPPVLGQHQLPLLQKRSLFPLELLPLNQPETFRLLSNLVPRLRLAHPLRRHFRLVPPLLLPLQVRPPPPATATMTIPPPIQTMEKWKKLNRKKTRKRKYCLKSAPSISNLRINNGKNMVLVYSASTDTR